MCKSLKGGGRRGEGVSSSLLDQERVKGGGRRGEGVSSSLLDQERVKGGGGDGVSERKDGHFSSNRSVCM